MALLGFGYLYSILEPADHLHDFPIAHVYGAIAIPSDFPKRLVILGTASVVPGDVEKPVLTGFTRTPARPA